MLSNFKNLFNLTCQVIKKCEFQSSYEKGKLLSAIRCDLCNMNQRQNFHLGTPRMKDIKQMEVRRAVKQEARKTGKINIDYAVNVNLKRDQGFFPKGNLENIEINGVPFNDIPVVHVKAGKNNTILSLCDNGVVKIIRSCGLEGFKNTRKGTNVAAQTTGYGFGLRATKSGYTDIKVVVKGLGSGRLSAIKGLQLGGMNIVSITDATIDATSLRPRKQRRI